MKTYKRDFKDWKAKQKTAGVVFYDHESYWFPARPDQLTLIRKGGLR